MDLGTVVMRTLLMELLDICGFRRGGRGRRGGKRGREGKGGRDGERERERERERHALNEVLFNPCDTQPPLTSSCMASRSCKASVSSCVVSLPLMFTAKMSVGSSFCRRPSNSV